jgi:hypothetical protein
MSQPGPPAVTPDPDALRIVLFGQPDAGKSSLLGALAQAAQSQEHLLNGKLADRTDGLAALRKCLYDEHVRRTVEEVAPYPVDFEPFVGEGQVFVTGEQLHAVLIDSDGRVATDLLNRRASLDEKSPEGTLAREVVHADTLVLLVDASDTLPQIDANFVEFDHFLRLLEEDRGGRTEVGGLPVFLVLTKCDKLARSDDSAGSWMERIEERKRDMDTRFRDFLAHRSESAGPLPFGKLDLHMWATAVKRPALTNAPARDREPFGVAELFRQCFEQAATYRGRREQSGRRLLWTAGGVGGVVATMLAMMIGLAVTNRETPLTGLRAKVQDVRFSESDTAAGRLHGAPADLRQRLADFTALRDDPDYASLPVADRDFVRDRINELEEYIAFYEQLRLVPRPADVASVEQLTGITGQLQSLAPPHEDWADTEAGRLRADRLAEAEALAKAIARAKGWYDESTESGRDLWVFARFQPTPEAPAIDWRSWYDEVARLSDPARRLPFGDAEPIPGTKLPYATALRFDRVTEARAEWEGAKDKLQRVVDVAAALGLLGDVKGRPPLLVIPRPPDFPLDRCRTRLTELQAAYPRYKTEFVLAGLPDAVVASVRQAARSNYEYLLYPGRQAVLRHLSLPAGSDADTPAQWSQVGAWLAANPEELAAFRALALVLARLNDPAATDPVTALAAFLQKTSFTIEIREVALEVPFRHSEVKPQAGADFAIYHPATVSEGPAFACPPVGEGERDDARKITVYRFRPRDRQRLTYKPGEELSATLPLRGDRALTWTRSHSAAYQFERLLRPPRVHVANEPSTDGTSAEGIDLVITPADGVPRIPDLMPTVRPVR